jgi:hypothetical protein
MPPAALVVQPAAGVRPPGGQGLMAQLFWPAVVVAILGLFMLVAGIGPLWLPIVVLLVGVVAAQAARRARQG